jgi:hypothetical protein
MRAELRPRLRIVLPVALALLCLASSALAASVEDPNLARGPLDLKRLVADKHSANAPLYLRLVTYGSWRPRLLDRAGENRLFFLFDTDVDGRADFVGEIFHDGRLWMRLTRMDGTFLRRLKVSHPRPDTATTVVPRGLPNPDGNARVAAAERYRTATGPCATLCEDRIPSGDGWLKVTPGQ